MLKSSYTRKQNVKSYYNRITTKMMLWTKIYHAQIAFALLGVMGCLGLGSMTGNSAIVDEVAHIPAAYSYLHFQDYRLNPEHPPLIKDIAGLPLQYLNLKFPDTAPAWTTDVNGQWETGWNFLYHIGNDADKILFWSRLPILLLALGFGAALYVLVRRRWGTEVALMSLTFYSLSPNIIAHSTVVTTDLGASIFIFLALVSFGAYVERPTFKNLGWLSLALAVAQLSKFSAVILYPFFGLIALALVWSKHDQNSVMIRAKMYIGGLGLASIMSIVWIWFYYATQVAQMPLAIQDRLIAGSLNGEKIRFLGDALLQINHLPLMKPIVQYLLGLGMVLNRVSSGNVTYFNGNVSNKSFLGYFPELFLFKTQLALLLLATIVIVVIWRMSRARSGSLRVRAVKHFNEHVLEWIMGLFAIFFFVISVAGHLNLGIRHILPIYIPIFVLVSIGTMTTLHSFKPAHRKLASGALATILLWYGGSTIISYPNYLSYFNEAILGQGNSSKYFSDSSVDWGQDLKRLKVYVNDHPEITHIAVDYFGGGVPEYYFCDRSYDQARNLIATDAGYDCSHTAYVGWHAQNGMYDGQYIAVSETFLENDRYYAALHNRAGYAYLRAKQPLVKIGNSIYLYKLY